MKKKTKDALIMVLETMYENVKNNLISEVECCTLMSTSQVEESSRGVVHIAELLMELETDDIDELEWNLEDDDFEWIRDEYLNKAEYLLEEVKEILADDYPDEAMTVTRMILGCTPDGYATCFARELTNGHKFTAKDWGRDMNYADGEWIKDEDAIKFYKSLNTQQKATFLKKLDWKLECYGLTIRMSSGIDFTSEDGELIRLMYDNKRVRARKYLYDYSREPKYERLLESIVNSVVDDENEEGLWVYLGLEKYWRMN